MSLILTYWEDPPNGNLTGDDFDGIRSIVLKTVKQIPDLIERRPSNCTMISTERSAPLKNPNSKNVMGFKEHWRGPRGKRTVCLHCKGTGRI